MRRRNGPAPWYHKVGAWFVGLWVVLQVGAAWEFGAMFRDWTLTTVIAFLVAPGIYYVVWVFGHGPAAEAQTGKQPPPVVLVQRRVPSGPRLPEPAPEPPRPLPVPPRAKPAIPALFAANPSEAGDACVNCINRGICYRNLRELHDNWDYWCNDYARDDSLALKRLPVMDVGVGDAPPPSRPRPPA